jgi:PAS domain S-box-containing protein
VRDERANAHRHLGDKLETNRVRQTRRSAAVDAHRREPGNQGDGQKCKKCNPNTQPAQQGGPAVDDDGHVQLRVDFAVVVIVFVFPMDGNLMRAPRDRCQRQCLGAVIKPVFQLMGPIVKVFQRTAPHRQKSQQQRVGSQGTHGNQFSPNASDCQEETRHQPLVARGNALANWAFGPAPAAFLLWTHPPQDAIKLPQMNRLEVIFYCLSTIFQAAAMVFTALMIRAKGDRRPWIMLFTAMAVMLTQRILAIARGGGPPAPMHQFISSWLAVGVSALLFGTLFYVRQLSLSQRQSADIATRRGVERDDARVRLSAAMQAAEVATWVWAVPGDRLFGDESLGEMFNLCPSDDRDVAVGRYLQSVHPDDLPRVRQTLADALASDVATYQAEYRLAKPDGSWRWLAVRGRIDRDATGKPERVIGVVLDITARKQSELAVIEAQRETEERLRHLADTLPQLVWISRADGTSEFYNKRWYDYVGATGDQAATNAESLHLDDRQASANNWAHALDTGEPYEIECRIRRVDGEYRWFLARALPLRDRDGRVTKWFGTCTDIHEQKRNVELREHLLNEERAAREEAERNNRMKDEFLATLSHELRTPLNAIVGWAELMKRHQDQQTLQEGAEVIERNARIQTQLIEDLLDMSRIVSGKIRLEVQSVNPATIVDSAIETVMPTAKAKNIHLTTEIDRRCGFVLGDPGRLQQVIWNLLSNAIKFTPSGGGVQIALGPVESCIEIAVTDTGQGIEPQFLPHVFERFRQADASPARRHGGLGLGLAIVKQLVELHGGTVRAESAGQNHGARFVVSLPVHATRKAGAEASGSFPGSKAEADLEAHRLNGVNVLLVDDEPDARELVARLLKASGASVTSAGSGAEALTLSQSHRPDILISDIGMPGMDGYELLRRMREGDGVQGGRIPAVALTAFARSEDRTRALLAGFLVHVAKPVQPSELVATVASITGRTGRD